MQLPIEIRFHKVDRSDVLEAAIREHAAKLEHFSRDIVSCRVSVDAPHKHQTQGRLFRVAVTLRMPGGEVVVSRSPSEHHAHEDPFVAVRDAFRAVRRQLQDYERKRRGQVKSHET